MTEPTNHDPPTAGITPLRFLTITQVADELASKPTLIRGLITPRWAPRHPVGARGQWRIERIKLEEYITMMYSGAAEDLQHDPTDPTGPDTTEGL